MNSARCPARGSSIRRSSRASATSSCWRGPSSTASSTACTARRTSARRSTSPSTAATCPATTSAASTGGCSRAPTATTSSSTRPTRTPTSRSLLDVSKSMGFASGGVTKLEYGAFLAACLAYLAHRQRDRVGLVTFDEDIVDARAAVGEAPRRGAAHARPGARPSGPGALRAPLPQAGRALQAPRHPRADLRLLRRAGRDPRRGASRCGSAATT